MYNVYVIHITHTLMHSYLIYFVLCAGSIGKKEGDHGKKLEEAIKRVDQARESLEKIHKIFYRVLPIKLAHERLLHKLG